MSTPVCQEIEPDGIPQEWIAAEHNPAVVDGVGCFPLVGNRKSLPHLINALFWHYGFWLRSSQPAGWLAVNSDIRCSIFLTSFPYSATTIARSSMLSDRRRSSRYSIYGCLCRASTNKGIPVFLWLFGRIFFFPSFQQTQVVAQHPKHFLLCLPVSHFLADFSLITLFVADRGLCGQS